MNPTERANDPLQIDAAGWCNGAHRLISPNCDSRPPGCCAELLVIHNISLPPGQFGGPYIADLFANRLDSTVDPYFAQLEHLRVSAHFLVRRDGALHQFVSTFQRAWHAGVSCFEERAQCNNFSIGIELEGTDDQPFSDAQYLLLGALTIALQQSHSLRAVCGHQHIAPGRKTDPGPYFDWNRYHSLCSSTSTGAGLRFVTTEQTLAKNAIKKTV